LSSAGGSPSTESHRFRSSHDRGLREEASSEMAAKDVGEVEGEAGPTPN